MAGLIGTTGARRRAASRRSSAVRYGARNGRSRRGPAFAAAAALLGLVIVATMVLGLMAWSPGPSAPGTTLIVAEQVTQNEADPAAPTGLLDRATALAADGTATLVVVQAAGDGGRQVAAAPLRVEREPGHLDNDPSSRRVGTAALVDAALTTARRTPAVGDGRDLAGLLTAVSAVRGQGQNEVWLSTFGLGTTPPADTRVLTAADPAQAAQSVAAALPPGLLDRTTVHLVLTAPAGTQSWLNPRTSAWRSTFVVDLLKDLGATLGSVQEDLVARPARPDAPLAPVVENLPETNPPSPTPPGNGPIELPLDSAALFAPDSATFAGGDAAAAAALRPVIDAVRGGRYGRVEVTGRCARFGEADTARELSLDRATAVARLLRDAGVQVADADVHGLGFDSPLPPDPRAASNRSVTVTAHPSA